MFPSIAKSKRIDSQRRLNTTKAVAWEKYKILFPLTYARKNAKHWASRFLISMVYYSPIP